MKSKLGAYSLLLSFLLSSPAAWSVTASEIINAIDKGKVLAPSIRVNAQVRPDVVFISTYKNLKANDRDCKIEAVLLAKTVMDLAPEIPRVEVRFYNPTNLSKFKHINVTAGDVKAFASGTIKEDQLLNGLILTESEASDANAKLASHLEENQYLRAKQEITSSIEGKKALITAGLDPTLGDLYVKIEALKLAANAFEALGAEIDEVDITFVDPGKDAQDKEVIVKRGQETQIAEALNLAFKELPVKAKTKDASELTVANIESYEVKDGQFKDERAALLKRLKTLAQAGVNFGRQILAYFVEIENGAETMPEPALREKIAKFSELLDKFEENYKKAKGFKPQAATPAATAGGAACHTATAPSGLTMQGGGVDVVKAHILADPQAYVRETVASLQRRSPTGNGEDHPNFPKLMQFAIQTLKEKGRNQEASAIEARLKEVQKRNGQ